MVMMTGVLYTEFFKGSTYSPSLFLSFSPFYGNAVCTLQMLLVSTTDSYLSWQRWYGSLIFTYVINLLQLSLEK